MTLFGRHTLAETEDLMKTVEFRIKITDKANNSITQEQVMNAGPAFVADAEQKWSNFRFRWATMREKVGQSLINAKLANQLVDASMIPTEDEYKAVKKAINVGGEDTWTDGDLTDCMIRIQKISGDKMDEANHPMPTGFDPDIKIYQNLDDVIKKGEAAIHSANPFSDDGKPSFFQEHKTGLIIGGVVLAAAVGYSVIKTGKQVAEKAERDTKFLHENFTSKFLPGYKG